MTQDEAIASLKTAYDAANAALEKAQDGGADPTTINKLNDAANFALRCLAQAMKEELTADNQLTQKVQSDLDAATTKLKTDLQNDSQIIALVADVDSLVKLAGALSSAFA